MNRFKKGRFASWALVALGALLCLPAHATLPGDTPFGCQVFAGPAYKGGDGQISSDKDLNSWFKQIRADCDPHQGYCPQGFHNDLQYVGEFATTPVDGKLVFNFSQNSQPQKDMGGLPPAPDGNGCYSSTSLGSGLYMDKNSTFSCSNNGKWSSHVWIRNDGDWLPTKGSIMPYYLQEDSPVMVLGCNPGAGTAPCNNELLFVGDACPKVAGNGAWTPSSICSFHKNASCQAVEQPVADGLTGLYKDLLKDPQYNTDNGERDYTGTSQGMAPRPANFGSSPSGSGGSTSNVGN